MKTLTFICKLNTAYLIFMKRLLILLYIMANACMALGQKQPASYVDPFIGTDHMGHTYPGATVPFGMVQLSPETDTVLYSIGKGYNPKVYEYCAGYQYKDQTIVGFSHTHFSGTGHSDLGDFLLMPSNGALHLNPGTSENPSSGYRSRFSHNKEFAKAGYYAVLLEDYDIFAELTATTRVGMHRYTFNKASEPKLIFDMTSGIYNYDGKNIWCFARVENDTLITGYRQTRGWARNKYIYFAMVVSKPIKRYGYHGDEKVTYNGFYRKFNEREKFPEMAGKSVKAWFEFDIKEGEQLLVKVALSSVSTEGALKNLQVEVPHFNFEKVKDDAFNAWNNELSKVKIEASEDKMKSFYTSMYHAFISPTVYMDIDKQYRGLDQNIHKAESFTNYTTFSLWDTYRASHPLFTLLQPQRASDMINSMLAHQQQSVHKILPIWSHHANENWCMIGYHATSVIADAYMKGLKGFDENQALDAMLASANYDIYDGIGDYKTYGYVPADKSSNAASKTLEYAYDDYCIAQMANKMGKNDIAEKYYTRAASFASLFDKNTGFIRPKNADGSWVKNFDPLATEGQGFIEGNAWNYSLYVPHNISKLIDWAGGNDKFSQHLDSLFTLPLDEKHIAASEDIDKRGIIGRYVHGNEPGHQIPYMYVYAGAPWKTQQRVHQIIDEMYKPNPDGLPGNDDCGQMSAWYIFSALGFYPVCPGNNEYVFGSPCIEKAELKLENGNTLQIIAKGADNGKIYIKSISLNGKPYPYLYITHHLLLKGGVLEFEMSNKPLKYNYKKENFPSLTYQ